jgi:hypothetical protein
MASPLPDHRISSLCNAHRTTFQISLTLLILYRSNLTILTYVKKTTYSMSKFKDTYSSYGRKLQQLLQYHSYT